MKVVFDFDLDCWVKDLEIEAKSVEEAKEKLFELTVEEIIEKGWVKDFDIRSLDYETETDNTED